MAALLEARADAAARSDSGNTPLALAAKHGRFPTPNPNPNPNPYPNLDPNPNPNLNPTPTPTPKHGRYDAAATLLKAMGSAEVEVRAMPHAALTPHP